MHVLGKFDLTHTHTHTHNYTLRTRVWKHVLYFSFSNPLLCWTLCKLIDLVSMSSIRSSTEMVNSRHSWALSGISCGISCLLTGFETITWIVQQSLLAHSSIWQLLTIHITARTNQLSKEKQQSVIISTTEGQSLQNIAKTLNVSPNTLTKNK